MRIKKSRSTGFTLVELMIAVAVIGLISAMALPGYLRARKRAQGVSILEDLRTIDSAMDQYALEYSRSLSCPNIPIAAWRSYLKPGSRLYTTSRDIFGQAYGDQTLGVLPQVPATSYDSLQDVCDAQFWAPYVRSTP